MTFRGVNMPVPKLLHAYESSYGLSNKIAWTSVDDQM